MTDMLTVDEARTRVLEAVKALEPVEVLVGEAYGLVTAERLVAAHPLPRFDNSAMDGYAVVAADVGSAGEENPVALEIVGEVRAGEPGDVKVAPGTAARIMTGAPLPPGADAVVPVEETAEENGRVLIKAGAHPGQHLRPAGDDLDAGAVLVEAGMELGAGELALLASMGMSPLKVRRGPRVAVLITGDELVDPEVDPAPGQIRDSNGLALVTLLRGAGAEVVMNERVPDRREAVLDAFRRASGDSDLVLSSGGVAVGKYDFVKETVEQLGSIDLWRVAMQPGKPVVLGRVGSVPFMGLPGNPVSVHVGFEQFVRPAIRKMRGCVRLLRPTIEATLTEPVEKRPGRLHFVRVRLAWRDGQWHATPTGPQGSHIQSSLVDCHGVARFHIEETRLEAGTRVVVELWRLPQR